MIFTESKLQGMFTLAPELREDSRGFFARTFCRQEFEAHGLNPCVVQCSVSFNKTKGTLRGLHYQQAPHAEAKLVRCTHGAIFDVIVDLRSQSPTFRQWVGLELTAENRLAVYIPEGCAHGFFTLHNDSEIFYQMSEFYHPECARGLRWNDPAFQIAWPGEPVVISERDSSYPSLGQ